MKKELLSMSALASLLALVACSDANFSAAPATQAANMCVDGRPEVLCQTQCDDLGNCFREFDYTIEAGKQPTDILFVVDNSASMHNEQASMAQRFPSFMSSIQHLDYRIAMTTTDVSITPNNDRAAPNNWGAWQDGKLIPFAPGLPFLDGSLGVANEQQLFQNNVQRQETLECAQSGFHPDHCPSGDERAIYASILNIENNYHNWIRASGHLAIVILSDEDEGSDGIFVSQAFSGVNDQRDRPQNFISFVQNTLPNKSLAVHSIIVRPGDTQCFNQQAAGPILGQYGFVYEELSHRTGGVVGNICSSNFTPQLQDIGQSVSNLRERLPCQPIDNQVDVSFIPQRPSDVSVNYRPSQNEVVFNGVIPQGTSVRLQYRCHQ